MKRFLSLCAAVGLLVSFEPCCFLTVFFILISLLQVLDNHSWVEEKNQLVQAHNDAKVKLITEIQTLRKMLTPTAEQHFNELRGSEFLRVALEEEVINTHIQNDNLKVCLIRFPSMFLLHFVVHVVILRTLNQ